MGARKEPGWGRCWVPGGGWHRGRAPFLGKSLAARISGAGMGRRSVGGQREERGPRSRWGWLCAERSGLFWSGALRLKGGGTCPLEGGSHLCLGSGPEEGTEMGASSTHCHRLPGKTDRLSPSLLADLSARLRSPKTQVGTPTGLSGTPRKILRPQPSSSPPCLRPRTGQLPKALGGAQDCGCGPPLPPPPQDGPELVSQASPSTF